MSTFRVQFDARGHEVTEDHSTSVLAEPGSFDSIQVRDTRAEKISLWDAPDPVRAEQAQVDILEARLAQAQAFAVAPVVFNQKTGKPFPSSESEVARRSTVARQMMDSFAHDVDMAQRRLTEQAAQTDGGAMDLIRELEEQNRARAEAAAAKMARRA